MTSSPTAASLSMPIPRRVLVVLVLALLLLTGVWWVSDRQSPQPDVWAAEPSLTSLNGWLYPREENRFLRNRIAADLMGVTFAGDGYRGWAVGDGGALLATVDGGNTWRARSSDTTELLSSATFSGDGRRGWAVGYGGAIVATADGGATWRAQSSGTRVRLFSVTFAADGLRGWAVGDNGSIVATLDGGTTWRAQTSGTTESLWSVTFALDGQRGWAVGYGGAIVATADGGATWRAQSSGTTAWLVSVTFTADGQRGWVVGSRGTILATANGGGTWRAQTSDTNSGERFRSIAFAADGQRGWVVGFRGTIVATVDGGNTWRAQTSHTNEELTGVTFAADGQRGWAVGRSGTVVATVDAGITWRAQSSGAKAWFDGVTFAADGQRGWVVGSNGTVVATGDAGTTWRAQSSGAKAWFHGVTFAADGQRGWVVGSNGTIVATVDGGTTWRAQTSRTTEPLVSVTMTADGQRGWAVGRSGTVVATVDAGTTWRAQSSGTTNMLWGVTITADGKGVWAVGDEGVIVATVDGGTTWRAQTSRTTEQLVSVAFNADGRRGWAVGSKGVIIATEDGGITWRAQTSGTREWLSSVTFASDGLRGWAVGARGTIVATVDSGSTWRAQASGTSERLRMTFTTDGQRGWAVGDGGTIVATLDGGNTWRMARYRRQRAFWSYAAFVALLAAAWWATRLRPEVVSSIVATGRADAPIDRETADRLGAAPTARALARFILNRSTRPPLTVAISAPWGQGKSSLMRLVQARLERAGTRTVWFNAWHHQQEAVPAVALLESVRDQGIPFWASPAGLRFRIRLLWARMHERPWLALLLLSALVASAWQFGLFAAMGRAAGALAANPLGAPGALVEAMLDGVLTVGGWLSKNDAVLKLFSGEFGAFGAQLIVAFNDTSAVALNTLFAGVFIAAIGFLGVYWWRAFPERPAALMASVAKTFKLADVVEQTTFRQRFRRHFAQVAGALAPNHMVIFIDDIDRCDAAKAVEFMETVNYLADSGPCVIVLGLAEDVVRQQVALHFKDVAAMDGAATLLSPADEATSPGLRYADRYLRKIINLRIRVPRLDDKRIRAMLDLEPRPESLERRIADAREVLVFTAWPLMKRVAVLAAALYLGNVAFQHLTKWQDGRATAGTSTEASIRQDSEAAYRKAADASRLTEMIMAQAWRDEVALSEATAPEIANDVRLRALTLRDLAALTAEQARAAKDAADRKDRKRAQEAADRAEKLRTEAERILKGRTADGTSKSEDPSEQVAKAPGEPVRPVDSSSVAAPTEEEREIDWTPRLLAVLAVALLGYFGWRGSRRFIVDTPNFRAALAVWSPILLASDQADTPREVRRFENVARFVAMRLGEVLSWFAQWVQRRDARAGRGVPATVVPTTEATGTDAPARGGAVDDTPPRRPTDPIPEDVLVAFTALRQLDPRLLHEPDLLTANPFRSLDIGQTRGSVEAAAPPYAPGVIEAVREAIARHENLRLRQEKANEENRSSREAPLTAWPPKKEWLDDFFEAVGEISTEPTPVAATKS
jgi:photosystem II stability/assembly factor-like uncharacterized protein